MRVKFPYHMVEEDCRHGEECHPPCSGRELVERLDIAELKKRYTEAVEILECLYNEMYKNYVDPYKHRTIVGNILSKAGQSKRIQSELFP